MFATGSNDKIVKLWDSRSGALRSMITGSVQSVMYVAFSSNEELILGTGNDNTTRVWGVEQCRIRVSLLFPPFISLDSPSSPSLSFSHPSSFQHTLTGHTAKVYVAEFTSDSKRVVSGRHVFPPLLFPVYFLFLTLFFFFSHDRTLKLWDLSRGYCTRTIFCFSSCNDLALNTTGSVITSAHFDGSARMWDSRQGENLLLFCLSFIAPPFPLSLLIFTLFNLFLFLGDSIRTLNVHQKPITSCCNTNDGRFLLTMSRDNTLKLTDLRTFETYLTFKYVSRSSPSLCLLFSISLLS
jgi:autophagy-related protein 16